VLVQLVSSAEANSRLLRAALVTLTNLSCHKVCVRVRACVCVCVCVCVCLVTCDTHELVLPHGDSHELVSHELVLPRVTLTNWSARTIEWR
jgi:hypothetical protein